MRNRSSQHWSIRSEVQNDESWFPHPFGIIPIAENNSGRCARRWCFVDSRTQVINLMPIEYTLRSGSKMAFSLCGLWFVFCCFTQTSTSSESISLIGRSGTRSFSCCGDNSIGGFLLGSSGFTSSGTSFSSLGISLGLSGPPVHRRVLVTRCYLIRHIRPGRECK